MSFPLLRLPSVAVRCVLKQVGQNDAMKLGLCSKRAKNLVKYEREVPLEKPLLVMRFGTCYEVTVIREIMIYVEDLSKAPENADYWAIDGEKVSVSKENEITYKIYFENRLSGTQKLVSYLSDIFNIPIYGLSIVFTQVQEVDPRIAIDWVMSRQKDVTKIQLFADIDMRLKEMIHYALNKGKATEWLCVCVNDYFNPSLQIQSTNKELVQLLTFDDLIQSDCRTISIRGPSFTNVDIRQFLKSWMNGGNPKLVHLELLIEQLDIEMITNGLGATKVTHEEPVHIVLGPDEKYQIRDSWDITRNDGRKMSIVDSRSLSSFLNFYVLPVHE